MTLPAWDSSTWSRVCDACFNSDEAAMLAHAVEYLNANSSNLPPHLHLGREFRDIVGARNRGQWWSTGRDLLIERAREARGSIFGRLGSGQVAPPLMLLGRSENDQEGHERAPTRRTAQVSQAFTSGAIGTFHVELYESRDQEDRGGVVLRLRMTNGGCAYLPAAVLTEEGLDLHIAGDAEGEAMLTALELLLTRCRASRPHSGLLNAATIETLHSTPQRAENARSAPLK